ncbi:hypothetical protein GCM10011380_17770 [Sphingomonas metalli]|uniref:Uncharacterized protein n=1 Tax=Sphingomonas metalli TaxID=1779358 RepID=A0A916T2T3_9SPHN|nr:hypothetical protein GCM10011380_17770 [Sphingomonas metalli]
MAETSARAGAAKFCMGPGLWTLAGPGVKHRGHGRLRSGAADPKGLGTTFWGGLWI